MKNYLFVGLFAIIFGVMGSVLAEDMSATLKDNTINSSFVIQEEATGSTIARFRGDGNVGIGMTNPNAKLNIAGNVAINGNEVVDSTGKWVGDSTGLVGLQRPEGAQ